MRPEKYTLYNKQGDISILPGNINLDYYIRKGFSLENPIKPDPAPAQPTPPPIDNPDLPNVEKKKPGRKPKL